DARLVPDFNARAYPLPVLAFEPEQSVLPTTPDHARMVLQDNLNRTPADQLPLVIEGERLRGTRACLRRWVELAQALVGRYPVLSLARFDEISDGAARESLLKTIVGELVPVEARESFGCAKPEETL